MSLNSVLKKRDGRIEIRFDFDRRTIDAVKKIPGRLWINDRRVWDFPGDEETLQALKRLFGRNITKYLDINHNNAKSA